MAGTLGTCNIGCVALIRQRRFSWGVGLIADERKLKY